jgi:hypothetical protein
MPSWPKSLPKKPLTGTMKIEIEPAIAVFTPEVGPELRRRRSTARREHHSGRFTLTSTQVGTLKSFHETTCADGALSFSMADWRTGVSATFAFDGAPSYEHAARSVWHVDIKVTKIP